MKEMTQLFITVLLVSLICLFLTKSIDSYERQVELRKHYITYREILRGNLDYELWERVYTYNRNALDVQK